MRNIRENIACGHSQVDFAVGDPSDSRTISGGKSVSIFFYYGPSGLSGAECRDAHPLPDLQKPISDRGIKIIVAYEFSRNGGAHC